MVGFTFNKKFSVGYSYGFGSMKLPGLGASSHEINLRIALGERNQRNNINPEFFVSYVDTERFYADQRVKQQKASEEIAKVKPVQPILIEVEEAEEEVPSSSHDDPRLVMSRSRKLSNVTTIRSETVNEGNSPLELPRGNYIIIGEYQNESDAKAFTDRLGNEGYRAEYGFVSRKRLWMVYIYRSDSRIGFRKKVLDTRTNPDFKNAWILSVL
jgi:hypothetical protein